LSDKIINTIRITRRNLNNNDNAATSQQSKNENSVKTQFASTTSFEIILQEKSSQDNNAVLLLLFNKDIDYKKLFVEKQAKRRKLQIKQNFCIVQIKNKYFENFFCQNKVRISNLRCFRENNFNSKNNKSIFKKRRFAKFIKSINLDLYYKKNFKK